MKQIVWGLVLSLAPSWVVATRAQEADVRVLRDGDGVVVIASGDTEEVDAQVSLLSGEADGAALASVDEDVTGDGRSEGRKVVRIRRLGSQEDADRGWLGVAIGQVPESLAAQLKVEGRGILIENVVEDSPADQAGLQVHDIILSINGDQIGTNVGEAVGIIKDLAPGDVAQLMVLRNGVNLPIAVTLGSRAELHGPKVEWKYESGPSAVIEDRLKSRGRMMFKDDEGNWIMKDLGDLDELDQLPAHVRAFVPKSGTRTIQIEAVNGDKNLRLEVKRDGSTIAISQEDDGPITVERTDPQQNETTMVYETAEELAQADPEAYELYSQAGQTHTITLNTDGEEGSLNFDFDWDFKFDEDVDVEGLHDHLLDEWEVHLEESLGASREAFEKHMAEAHRLMEELHGGAWTDDQGQHQVMPFGDDQGHAFMFRPFGSMAKPKHSFEARADGTIEVRIRKGDSELVQLFSNEQDLQRRAPDLYEKYDELMAIDVD